MDIEVGPRHDLKQTFTVKIDLFEGVILLVVDIGVGESKEKI